jgi:hypothetical protein
MEPTHRTWQLLPALSIVLALSGVLIGAGPVLGQTPPSDASPPPGPAAPQVGIVAPQPAPGGPEFGFEPAFPPEQTGVREENFYPERLRSTHQPAFLRGGTTTIRTSRTSGVRVGMSGWTAPRILYDMRESSGGAAFGLTIEWGTPMEPPPESTPIRR